MSIGRIGAKGFDPAKEIAKEYPHKWSSATLYRDFLRVIQRKYEEPQKSKYTRILENAFREHQYVDNEQRMKLMGTGPTTLGSICLEEEYYEKGIKHPEHPSRFDMVDIFAANLDCRRIHPLPYLVQRDVWYYFGLGEQQQDIIATKVHRIAKKLNDKYHDVTAEYRDECRNWITERLQLFEESMANATNASSISVDDANKVKQLFEYLDSDGDGYISYQNLFEFLNHATLKSSERDEILQMLHSADNIKLCTESWYYMCDVLYSLTQFLEDNPDEAEKEKHLTQRMLHANHSNPLYRKQGWNLQQFTDAYMQYNFFDLNEHFALLQQKQQSNTELPPSQSQSPPSQTRVYNLLTQVAQNTPSTALIVKHALSTGAHLYVHILNADDDPDKVTWEKLEEIHEKMGTLDVINRARETEEILPQDVLYYDPDECTSDIPAAIPESSIFWHAVFENQLQDLPDYVIQDYFDNMVKPAIEANNNGLYIEPKNTMDRDRMIEEHVYNEMEQCMQPWIWKRYAQMLTNPVYAITTWDDHHLLMNARNSK
mmetsp:Transcript_11486/g.17405  ORF Transcript_11486/g.17405 Transcript_11486/m.17405 type:complete len:543 (+) Transcript_11486:40-1668(+)|eukprot:CAMPEP_0202689986 /NCGR_PEP_ID=MMETSP1385-20130828/5139_1 /ASSEMBLY_ACC=CAM_ASM_000861 /TAXON_ID=933848 /ORGANISM="Elphidium margaritaceum" /LENGTH=542 /DNA_ID=CAMNT_0049345207 /DNA_START=30 /DNA_END=1658 /DNA_ORIENTATION=+